MQRRGALRRGTVGLRQQAPITLDPQFRAFGTVGAATTGTTVAGPLPTYAADDILIAELFCRGSTTAFTMPAGWQAITQFDVGTDRLREIARVLDALVLERANANEHRVFRFVVFIEVFAVPPRP